jgi:anti-sigma factor RsiW
MKHIFTPEDLIPYLYSEANLTERLTVKEALRQDPLLAHELEELRAAKLQFPQVKFNAPRRSLQSILNYSKSTALEEHV